MSVVVSIETKLNLHTEPAAFASEQNFNEKTPQRRTSRPPSNSIFEEGPVRGGDSSSGASIQDERRNLPYALPPLPALQIIDGSLQKELIDAPPSHKRSSSSIYYAAAWGSPYATPSPKRSAEPKIHSLKVASARGIAGYDRSERGNWLSDDSAESERLCRSGRIKKTCDDSWLDLHSDEGAPRLQVVRSFLLAADRGDLERLHHNHLKDSIEDMTAKIL